MRFIFALVLFVNQEAFADLVLEPTLGVEFSNVESKIFNKKSTQPSTGILYEFRISSAVTKGWGWGGQISQTSFGEGLNKSVSVIGFHGFYSWPSVKIHFKMGYADLAGDSGVAGGWSVLYTRLPVHFGIGMNSAVIAPPYNLLKLISITGPIVYITYPFVIKSGSQSGKGK